ncbi:hypothetical protein [Candidatus Uabimicrobium sp. HlEnr_7]|uniref:hypothetical protein n=1 Tax=Candidatus Uabimicrobium helgolandensis TaxID=3095367 RepID=UPI00355645D3
MYKYIFVILAILLFSNNAFCEHYVYISDITVEKKNSKGKHWDSFYGKPDIILSIYIWQNSKWLKLYNSPKFQNMYQVRETVVTEISISHGQKIKFEVTDKDLKKSDIIGDVEITINHSSLLEKQNLSFGRVKNLSFLTLPYKNEAQKDSYNQNRGKILEKQKETIATQKKIIIDYEKQLSELRKIVKEYDDSKKATVSKHRLSLKISDPLFTEKTIEADDIVVVDTNKSIKNRLIASGSYIVSISKKGYETLETKIDVNDNGIVAKGITLQHKFRVVQFLATDASEGGENVLLKGQDIVLLQNNERIDYQNVLLPGHYTLKINRSGYEKIQKNITVVPGEAEDRHYIEMVAIPRKVLLQIDYDVMPPGDLNPDKKYLLPLENAEKIDITEETAVIGHFNIVVEKAGYQKFTKEIFIKPSSEPYVLHVHMSSRNRYTLWKISSDFDVSPIPSPDEMDVHVNIRKKGYKPIENLEKSLSTRKLETEVRCFLEALPRQVIANISADNTLRTITPDVISLSRILDGTEQESVDIATKAPFKEYKPGRYFLRIYKVGYKPIEQELIIFPDDKHYVIKKEMVSMRRTSIIDVTSDYEDNKIKPDSMLIDRQNAEEGYKIKPGEYTLVLNKAGYYPIEKIINVTPSNKVFTIKGQFNAKPREVQFKIFGVTGEAKDVKVTIGDIEVRNGSSVVPRKLYDFRVECKGFVTHTFKSAIPPANEPYVFNATLKPKKRRVILSVTAEFPKGIDLEPLDIKTLSTETLQEATEVKLGKHELVIAKTGYESIRETVDVKVSEKPFYITRTMKAKKRALMFDLEYDVISETSNFLQKIRLKGKTIAFDSIVKSNDLIAPENYQLEIYADGYKPLSETITIHPAETPFLISQKLIALPRQVVFRITSDYDAATNLQECEILVDGVPVKNITKIKPGVHSLTIHKPGFHSISDEIKILAGTTSFIVEKQLVSIPRVVKVTLVDNENGKVIIPDLVTLDDSKVTGTAIFKPKNYHLIIEAEGYGTLSEDINIEPGVNDYVIKRFPNSSKRLILTEIKGDYNDKLLSPQQLTLNGVDIIPGTSKVRPGGHNLVIYVPGYEQSTSRVSITPSQYGYTIKHNLVSKKRKLAFNISNSLNPEIKIAPDKVLFNVVEIREGEEVKPGEYYVQIEKKGYDGITKMVKIEPSEDIYTLDVSMSPRARHLSLQIDGEYRPGVLVDLDEVIVNGEVFDLTNVLEAGDHSVILRKRGYEPLSFDITIKAGVSAFVVKKTMTTKPRQINVKVTSDFVPQDEIFEPELLTLAERDIVPEESFKPGFYEMVIFHPGYAEIREKIEVEPGEGVFQLERHLNPNRRRLSVDLAYDVKPTEKLGPHRISLRSLDDPEFHQVKEGDMISPGEYKVQVEKEAYLLHEGRIVVQPEVGPYVLSMELLAKHVQILVDLKYDVAPSDEQKSIGDYKVTFVDSTKIGRSVEHGNRIKPNSQILEIDQPGYEFRENKKTIHISPSEEPYWIRETLYAKPRPLSFSILDPRTKQLVTAEEVIINGETATPQAKFSPGIKYGLIAKFEKFQTINRTILIQPGEGPFVINVSLVAYKKYQMRIGKAYTNMIRDNIKFPLEVFIDGKQLEKHHIGEGEGFNLINYDFFAPQNLQSMRVVCGYYYSDLTARKAFDFRDLAKIDIGRLEEHLLQLARNSPRNALRRIVRLLKDSQDKYKIMALSRENRQRIANLLRDLTLNVEESKMRKKVIRKLHK